MSVGDWTEAELERFVEDRLLGHPAIVALLARAGAVPTYTVATLPTNLTKPQIVFVSDGGAGAVFRGWTGSTWVDLG